MNITKGRIEKAKKVVVYGPEGIGKSTLAAQFPDPLFADTEGSTAAMDVARFDKPTSWEMLKGQVQYVKQNRPCRTFVIDTIDWAERLCIAAICASHDKKGIEDFGYGNGYVYESEEFGRFLNSLQELVDCGVNVVLTAHAILRKFEQPDEMGSYDRWELKLGKKTTNLISPLVKEWADMVLFANYETYSVAANKEGTKHKAQGGRRVMFTTHHPCWDAKNRYGLPDKIDMDYSQIRHIIEQQSASAQPVQPVFAPDMNAAPVTPVTPVAPVTPAVPAAPVVPDGIPVELADLMSVNGVTEDEIRHVVSDVRHYFPKDTRIAEYPADFVQGVLVGAWEQVFELIRSERNNDESYPF